MNDDENEIKEDTDDLGMIHHRAGLSAVYEVGRRDGAADLLTSKDPDWILSVECIRVALLRAWDEGAEHGLQRGMDDYDSWLLRDNPYRVSETAHE